MGSILAEEIMDSIIAAGTPESPSTVLGDPLQPAIDDQSGSNHSSDLSITLQHEEPSSQRLNTNESFRYYSYAFCAGRRRILNSFKCDVLGLVDYDVALQARDRCFRKTVAIIEDPPRIHSILSDAHPGNDIVVANGDAVGDAMLTEQDKARDECIYQMLYGFKYQQVLQLCRCFHAYVSSSMEGLANRC